MHPILPLIPVIRGALPARMKLVIALHLMLASGLMFQCLLHYDSFWFAIPATLLMMIAFRFARRAARYHSGQTLLVDWSETTLKVVESPGIWHISTVSGLRRFVRNRSGYTVSLECGSTFHIHRKDLSPFLAAMLDAQFTGPREDSIPYAV